VPAHLPFAPIGTAAHWHRVAVAAVAALLLLECLWELWLAPLKPGGSWLALKALPLALIWPGLARGVRKSRQWLALLLPLYVAEAIVRALSETGRHSLVAWAATVLAVVAFVAVLATFRATRAAVRRPAAGARP
jgi:uncharacterized membrane protein